MAALTLSVCSAAALIVADVSPPESTRSCSGFSLNAQVFSNDGSAAAVLTNSADAASLTWPPADNHLPKSSKVLILLAFATVPSRPTAQVLLAGDGVSQTILLAA